MANVGFIYKIVSKDVAIKDLYVGATTNLKVRKHAHKTSCYNENRVPYNYNVYKFIRANGGFENFDLIQVERVEYDTKYELHARERHFVELLNATLNKQLPNRTNIESVRQYRTKHRNELNAKNYCVCGGKYTSTNKSVHFATNRHLLFLANQQATRGEAERAEV